MNSLLSKFSTQAKAEIEDAYMLVIDKICNKVIFSNYLK